MAKILLPNLSKYDNCASFFKDLMILNKTRHPKFSHRYLALALKWPISYTADLIQGRKRFTLKRALELAQYSKLGIFDTEKLIHLSLADSPDAKVQQHFSKILKAKSTQNSRHQSKTTHTSEQLFEYIEIGAVYEALKWSRRPLEASEIKNLLYTFKDLSVERIQKILDILVAQKVIQIKDQKVSILVAELVLDQFNDGSDGGIKIHRQYAQNFINFTEQPQFPGLFTSGFLRFTPDQFKEVAHRLLEVRNWMFSLSSENTAAPNAPSNTSSLYQFDINLVNILNMKK